MFTEKDWTNHRANVVAMIASGACAREAGEAELQNIDDRLAVMRATLRPLPNPRTLADHDANYRRAFMRNGLPPPRVGFLNAPSQELSLANGAAMGIPLGDAHHAAVRKGQAEDMKHARAMLAEIRAWSR